MIFPSRSQLASKQITRTGRAEAVTKEGLAATLLPGRQPDQMGQRHSLRPVRPRSCPGPLRNESFCCISTRMWALPLIEIVSIRAPARGATDPASAGFAPFNVSIRAPARGATRVLRSATSTLSVSIRAPARGATRCQEPLQGRDTVSIRAPARGATTAREAPLRLFARFNPRPPHGGRR